MLSSLGLSLDSEIHRGSRKLGLVSSLRFVVALRFFEFNPLPDSVQTGFYSCFALPVSDPITLPALWRNLDVIPASHPPLFFIPCICSATGACRFFFLSIPSSLPSLPILTNSTHIQALHLPRTPTPLNPSSYSCWINILQWNFQTLPDAPLMER